MQDLVPLLTLVGIAVLFWLLLVRPQARRQRELAHMQSTLEVGDEVMLTSGVYGTVHHLEDDVAEVEIAAGVVVKVARGAVGQVVRETEASAPDDQVHNDDGEVSEEN